MARFKPGQSGNPKGAPKRDWTWSGVLQKAVEQSTKDKKGKKHKVKELVAQSLLNQVYKGNVLAIKALMERMDGYPMQSTDLTSDGEKVEGVVVFRPEKNEDK